MISKLGKLRQLLSEHFDQEELRTLCQDLNVDYDDLPGEGKTAKGRELIARLQRRNQLDDLVAYLEKTRPYLGQKLRTVKQTPTPEPGFPEPGLARRWLRSVPLPARVGLLALPLLLAGVFAVSSMGDGKQPAIEPTATQSVTVVPTRTSAPALEETVSLAAASTPIPSQSAAPTSTSGSTGTPIELPSPDAGLSLMQTLTSQNRHTVLSVSLSPDGQQVAAGFYRDPVHIWRASDGTLLHRLEGRSNSAASVAFSSDGVLLATGMADTTVKLWQVSDGTFLRTLEGARGNVYSVAFSADGTLLAAGSQATVSLWRVSDGALLHTLTGDPHNVYAVAISPDGETVAAGGASLKVQLWEVDGGTPVHELTTGDWVRSLAFSPDSQRLAVGGGKRVSMWRVSDGSKLYDDLTGHSTPVSSIVFLPDGGETLATVSWDLAMRVWQVSDGQRLYTIEGFADAVDILNLAPDGRTLASSDKDAVQVWQVP